MAEPLHCSGSYPLIQATPPSSDAEDALNKLPVSALDRDPGHFPDANDKISFPLHSGAENSRPAPSLCFPGTCSINSNSSPLIMQTKRFIHASRAGCLATVVTLCFVFQTFGQSQAWPGAPADVTLKSKWATYVGGESHQGEVCRSATSDGDGNVYVLANTEAPDMTGQINARIPAGTYWALFLTKVDSAGQVSWSRWVGEGGGKRSDVAHDSRGNVYVLAQTWNPADAEGLGKTGCFGP